MGTTPSRNITLNLPSDLIRQAKVYAARNDITVTALIRELLERKLGVVDLERSREAGRRFLEIAERGPHFAGDPRSIKREDLYDRNWHRFLPKPDEPK